MKRPLPEKRWVENEIIFRRANELVTKNIDSAKAIAKEDDQQELVKDIDKIPLLFYCECADKKCRKRIKLTAKEYKKQHHNKRQFILFPGHQIPPIERVVSEADKYILVEKIVTPPDTARALGAVD